MKHLSVKIFFLLLAVTFTVESKAQGWCGTKITDEHVRLMRDFMESQRTQRIVIPKINKTINVTAWIIKLKNDQPSHNSSNILNAFTVLDTIFRPIGVSFSVCAFNYIENWQYAEWDSTQHDSEVQVLHYQPNTLNIYFTDNIVTPTGAAGYAPLPPSPDYMVISSNYNSFSDFVLVMAHELGHYFGLYHTFETRFGAEDVDRVNCITAGDLICDTEADPDSTGRKVNIDCHYLGQPLTDGANYYEPPTDNIMSYYSYVVNTLLVTECRCRFTTQQYIRMSQMFTAFRNNLW